LPWSRLLSVFCMLLLLGGCESVSRKGEEHAAPVRAEPVVQPLHVRWRESAAALSLDVLLSRFHGATLKRLLRKMAASPLPLPKLERRLASAGATARRARKIVAGLFGYRQEGGVRLSHEERRLWRRLAAVARGKKDSSAVDSTDLVRARHSLVAQTAKAWFHLQGIRQLRRRAQEMRDLHEQIVARLQINSRLERGGRDGVLAARKELARADSREKQLYRAERLAREALRQLAGSTLKETPPDADGVSQLPAALPLERLAQRSDLHGTLLRLQQQKLKPVWPKVALTTKHGRASAELSRLERLAEKALLERFSLHPATEPQRVAAKAFAATLRVVLREVKGALVGVRRLEAQRKELRQRLRRARKEVNRLRARYSARRARLLEILQAQLRLTDIAARSAYVDRRLQDQKVTAHFVLAMP